MRARCPLQILGEQGFLPGYCFLPDGGASTGSLPCRVEVPGSGVVAAQVARLHMPGMLTHVLSPRLVLHSLHTPAHIRVSIRVLVSPQELCSKGAPHHQVRV